jgi:hypothetical protein
MRRRLKYLKALFIISFFCSLITSCKKDEDISDPSISFVSPIENQSFNVPNTIIIQAAITDDSKISSVNINLVNENLIPVLNTISINPDANSYDVNMNYPISEISLTSGIYFIHIYAVDEFGNNKHKYQQISINAVPKKLKFISLVNYINSTTINAIKIDSLNNISSLFTKSSDYSASESNSNSQQLIVAGKTYGDLIAFDLITNQYCWTEPVVSNPPFAYFTNVERIEENIYVSFFDGDIRAYNSSGVQVHSVSPIPGIYPVKMIQFGSFLLVDYYLKTSQSNFKLALFTFSTSSLAQQLQTTLQIVDFFKKDNNNVYVFGNNAGQAELKIYNVVNNSLSTLVNLPVGKISSVVQIDATNFLIAHEQGVLLYQTTSNLWTNVILINDVKKLRFEEINSEIFIAEPHKLSKYSYPDFNLVNSLNIADSILNLHLIYNKN